MVMPRIRYGMYGAVTVAVQTSSASRPPAQPFASPRSGIRSQTTCAVLYLIRGQRAWQKARSWGHLLPWASRRAARLSCEERFDGCNLKLVQFYSLYFCCCLGLAHEGDFIGRFKHEMWNMGELYPLWSPGGSAQGITVHSAWQIVGGTRFSLRLRDSPLGCFGGRGGLREMRTTYPLCFRVVLPRSCLWGAAPGRGIFMGLLCGMERSVTVPCPDTTAVHTLMVWR